MITLKPRDKALKVLIEFSLNLYQFILLFSLEIWNLNIVDRTDHSPKLNFDFALQYSDHRNVDCLHGVSAWVIFGHLSAFILLDLDGIL